MSKQSGLNDREVTVKFGDVLTLYNCIRDLRNVIETTDAKFANIDRGKIDDTTAVTLLALDNALANVDRIAKTMHAVLQDVGERNFPDLDWSRPD